MKAEEMPPYRHIAERLAERLAELEQAIAHIKTWQEIGEKRDAAMQRRIASLEVQVATQRDLIDELLAAMERARIPCFPNDNVAKKGF